MLGWALCFLVIALVSALFGFTAMAPESHIAAWRSIYFVSLFLFVVCVVCNGLGTPRRPRA